ncbi:MAG: hypothetical protein MUP76_03730, partial [Acidimicrobiia bacterium]|nr:hypothetical protein [Acidimicrobiia bacterium]
MDDQHEEVEHIPWGELLASNDDGRRRTLYLAAGAVAALVLGIVVTRALTSPSVPQSTPAPVAEAVASTVPVPVTVVVTVPATDPTTTTTATPPVPVLYTEADLMAFPPDLAARAAATRAEW